MGQFQHRRLIGVGPMLKPFSSEVKISAMGLDSSAANKRC
jgi:hypothetical protein